MERVGRGGELFDDSIVDVPDGATLLEGASPVRGLVNPTVARLRNTAHPASSNPFDGADIHSHCHPAVAPPTDHSTIRTLSIVAAMTLVFIILEFTGGIYANSVAIRTDAAHMLSDFLSFLISIFSVVIGKRPATKAYSFGLYRAEILGAMVSILLIWLLTGVIFWMAVRRVIDTSFDLEPNFMLYTAIAGVVFNIMMGAVLHFSGHGHSHGGHGHSHGATGNGHSHAPPPAQPRQRRAEGDVESRSPRSPRTRTVSVTAYPSEEIVYVNKKRNINVHAAFIHVLGDLVQSIGVLIAALIIKFGGEEKYKLADPICTFIFSFLVILTTLTVCRDTLRVLMEGMPRDVDYHAVRADLEKVAGVKAAHSLHMWSLTMDKAALAVHLAIDGSVEAMEVTRAAEKMVRYNYNVAFTTIQVEPWEPDIMRNCPTCIGPVA